MKFPKRLLKMLIITTALLFMFAAFNGCAPPKSGDSDDGGSSGGGGGGGGTTMSEFVTTAWTAYNQDDMSETRTVLNQMEGAHFPDYQTYAPYWNVNGWLSAAENNLSGALTRFAAAISFDSTLADAYVGKAGIHLINDEFSDAITSGTTALALDSIYSPGHDSLSADHVHLLLAEAYFYNGDLANSLLSVQAVNPAYSDPDPISLLTEIQRLSQALP